MVIKNEWASLIVHTVIVICFIVQYPIQFSGPPRNISNPCSALLCAASGCSTNTTRIHALLLSSKH